MSKAAEEINMITPHGMTERIQSTFHGAVVDSGASRTVIGHKQARNITSTTSATSCAVNSSEHSRRAFRFGSQVVCSVGQIEFHLPVGESFISFQAFIVPIDVPLLLGLDVMQSYGMKLCTKTNSLSGSGWTVPLHHVNGHLMLPLPNSISDIHFSKLELVRMHNGFHHPSAGKLYIILQRAKPTEVPPHLLSVLEDISKYCETCQRTARKPLRFQATIPRDLVLIYERKNKTLFFS
jgi:hypothetical protein